MHSRSGTRSGLSRRSVLRAAAVGSVSAIAAPHVRGGRAAGILTLGVWDHWVPGANNALTALCSEWGAKNSVEVRIDYITGQGEKDKLTAAAEAQAGAGHDIMSHRDWNIRIHADALEPLDDVVGELIKQYGPASQVAEYLGKIKGAWRGIPATRGSQVKPCCSRFDLYKEHAGIDLRDMFPADEFKMGQSQDRYLDLGPVSHRRRKALQGRLSGWLADGPDQRRRRLGWRAVQRLRRRHGRRQGQHQDQFR